jgi:hypothetical protein
MLIQNENLDWRKVLLAPMDDTECDRLMMIESSDTEMQTRKRRQPSAGNAESSGSPPIVTKEKQSKPGA